MCSFSLLLDRATAGAVVGAGADIGLDSVGAGAGADIGLGSVGGSSIQGRRVGPEIVPTGNTDSKFLTGGSASPEPVMTLGSEGTGGDILTRDLVPIQFPSRFGARSGEWIS